LTALSAANLNWAIAHLTRYGDTDLFPHTVRVCAGQERQGLDLEDRYETRLRAMIEAKLKGEGIEAETPEVVTSNVID
jgi:hypothetical protein